MDLKLYINCFLIGLLGMLFHLVAIKLPAVKKRALTANMTFSVKEYLKEDILAILTSFMTIVIGVLLLDELIGYNPSMLRFIKWFFLFVGYTGSSLLIGVLGKFDNTVQKVVDIKTDIADAAPKYPKID